MPAGRKAVRFESVLNPKLAPFHTGSSALAWWRRCAAAAAADAVDVTNTAHAWYDRGKRMRRESICSEERYIGPPERP